MVIALDLQPAFHGQQVDLLVAVRVMAAVGVLEHRTFGRLFEDGEVTSHRSVLDRDAVEWTVVVDRDRLSGEIERGDKLVHAETFPTGWL
ncbi:hypothetical protein [Ensifer adhaerens]|uniref:hypothetical protein n=1 Tax=Ensifer adhaerens TaxID=106592 RepID=UPI003F843E9D